MTVYKNQNNFLQFELWKDCHIGCSFCVNKGQPDLNKTQSLIFVLEKINSDEIKDYNEIGFIGGEFFNGELKDPIVKSLFYKIFECVSDLIHKGYINKLYITTALIFDMNEWLIPFLEQLEEWKILDKTLLCTSYDIAYRFHTKEREELWKNNMLQLKNQWQTKGLLVHTETILTQPFIDSVLSGNFNITEFCDLYKTRIDYIEPASGLYYKNKQECAKDISGFFPTKKSFIKFIQYTLSRNEIDLSTFLSMELRSSKLYYIDGGKRLVQEDRRSGEGKAKPCDCTKLYEIGFIDSDDRMIDVARLIGENYEDE